MESERGVIVTLGTRARQASWTKIQGNRVKIVLTLCDLLKIILNGLADYVYWFSTCQEGPKIGSCDCPVQKAGIRIADDIAVMGFDNVAQSAQTIPPLTTVEVPKSAMGMLAMHRLRELITGTAPEVAVKNVLYTSVVPRASA